MKIYSKFKDFYDIGLSYGIDDDIKFIRETTYVDLSEDLKDFVGHDVYGRRYNQNVSISIYAKYLFFCGKMIPYLQVVNYGKPDIIFYSAEPFHAFVKTFEDCYHNGFNVDAYMNNERKSWLSDIPFGKKGIEDFFKTGKDIGESLFFKYDCPYFIIGYNEQERHLGVKQKRKVIKNPVLKNMDFFKYMDSYTTFQEISMFLGGVLGSSPKEIIKVSDEVLRDKRGFDEWSFKKMKQVK